MPDPPAALDRPAEGFDTDTQVGLLAALRQVLSTLGGAATARDIVRALSAEPGRFPDLVAVLKRLWPDLEPGDPTAPTALGYRLRGLAPSAA